MKKLFKKSSKKSLMILFSTILVVISVFIIDTVFLKSNAQAAPPFDLSTNRKLSIYGGVISLVNKVGNNTYATEIDAYRIRSTSGIGVQAPLIGNLVSGPNLVRNGDAASVSWDGTKWVFNYFTTGEPFISNPFGQDSTYYISKAIVDGPFGGKTTAFDFFSNRTYTAANKANNETWQMAVGSDPIAINPHKTYLLEGWLRREGTNEARNYLQIIMDNDNNPNNRYPPGNPGDPRRYQDTVGVSRGTVGKWEYWSGIIYPTDPDDTKKCQPDYYPTVTNDQTSGLDPKFYCGESLIKYVYVAAYGLYTDQGDPLSGTPTHAYWTGIRLTELGGSSSIYAQNLNIDANDSTANISDQDAISTKINSGSRSALYAENPSGYAGYFSGTVFAKKYCLGPDKPGTCIDDWADLAGGGGSWTQNGNNLYPTNSASSVGIGTQMPGARLTVNESGNTLPFHVYSPSNNTGILAKFERTTGGESDLELISVAAKFGLKTQGPLEFDAGATLGDLSLAGDLTILSNGNVGIGTIAPLANTGLDVRAGSGRIVGNGLFFSGSGIVADGLPPARLTESWGMRYTSPDNRWVFSSNPSMLIGYEPTGQDWGSGNLLVSGNVGIAQTAPLAKLTVNNNISDAGSATDAIFAAANNATGAAISARQTGAGYAGYFSGKVNITGATHLYDALTVDTWVQVTGTLTAANIIGTIQDPKACKIFKFTPSACYIHGTTIPQANEVYDLQTTKPIGPLNYVAADCHWLKASGSIVRKNWDPNPNPRDCTGAPSRTLTLSIDDSSTDLNLLAGHNNVIGAAVIIEGSNIEYICCKYSN